MSKSKYILVVCLSGVLLSAVAVSAFFVLNNLAEKEDEVTSLSTHHEHSYLIETLTATCGHGGYTLYTCDCGDFYKTNDSEPLEHEYGDWGIIQAATVENEGQKERRCLHCNERVVEAIPKIENHKHKHKYKDKVVKPTCTEEGYIVHTCSTCGYKETDSEIAASGHSWSSWKTTKKATTDTPGEKTRSCKTCGAVKTEVIPKLVSDEHTHSYASTVVAPTCSDKGYTRYTCSCGASYDDNEVSALGHLYGDWTVTKQPTTTSTGTRVCVCAKCGHELTEKIDKLEPEVAEKYESYVDSRVEITTLPDGALYYHYEKVTLIDTRSWGDPPSIRITSSGGFKITYFKKDGSKVEKTLKPVDGYVNRMVIFDNGSYQTNLIGDFSD